MKLKAFSVIAICLGFLRPYIGQAQFFNEDQSTCFTIVGEAKYDFGSINPIDQVEHTFVFRNNCTNVVEIKQARASCGCTAAIVSEKIVQPGSEAKIRVAFTPPRGSMGHVSKTVSVFLQDETKPHTVLQFSANVISDLDINPKYLQLTSAEIGVPVIAKTTVVNKGTEAIDFAELQLSLTSYADTSKEAGGMSTAMYPLKSGKVIPSKLRLAPGESHDVYVSVIPEFKGQINGHIYFKSEKTENYVQVFGVVQSEVRIFPEAVIRVKKSNSESNMVFMLELDRTLAWLTKHTKEKVEIVMQHGTETVSTKMMKDITAKFTRAGIAKSRFSILTEGNLENGGTSDSYTISIRTTKTER